MVLMVQARAAHAHPFVLLLGPTFHSEVILYAAHPQSSCLRQTLLTSDKVTVEPTWNKTKHLNYHTMLATNSGRS